MDLVFLLGFRVFLQSFRLLNSYGWLAIKRDSIREPELVQISRSEKRRMKYGVK